MIKTRQSMVFTKYDALQRPIWTGTWNNGGTAISRASLQSTLNGIRSNLYEGTGATGNGYTNVAWPTTNVTATLTLNYYDGYTVPNIPANYKLSIGVSLLTRGLPTAKVTAVLNTPTDQLWDVLYYDDLGRATKTYAQHYLGGTANTNDYDLTTTTYNFTNQPTSVTRQHFNTGSTTVPQLTVTNTFLYDQAGRKLKSWEQLQYGNNSATPKTLISQIDYNEVGQVFNKHLHSTDSVNFLQNIAYTYNERGWLVTSSAPLFAMQLYYNTGYTKGYNGNIMYQYWGTPGNLNNSYAYLYDKLNRYITCNASSGGNAENAAYDVMGNISWLNRNQSNSAIDQLTYGYTDGSGNLTNQVQSVSDRSGSNGGLVNGATTYTYDGNGNELTQTNTANIQQNKSFQYNLLNLPQSVTANTSTTTTTTLTYTYDAAGNKLRRKSTGLNNTTDYIAGIQYDGATTPAFNFIQTEEGKAVYQTSTGGFEYQYYLGDNLGNTRITFGTKGDSTHVYQKDDYYPFGMEINSYTNYPKNEYLYNKKELQEEIQEYDYGARFYDPVIARWTSIDMLSELSVNLTPYRYCYDNPINFTDPLGLWESTANGYTTSDPKDIERFSNYMKAEEGLKVTPTFDQVRSFVKDEKAGHLGKLTDGSILLNGFSMHPYHNVITGISGWTQNLKQYKDFLHQVQGSLTPDALDPRTWHNNILGLSYAGANNPKTYSGKEDYSHMPDQVEDIPAYVHDLDYNKLGARGGGSLFNDPSTQGANAKLVNSEVMIMATPGISPISKARAFIVAEGIAAADLYNVASNALKDFANFSIPAKK